MTAQPEPGSHLPPHVRAEVQRILDGAAQRILRERMEAASKVEPGPDPEPTGES